MDALAGLSEERQELFRLRVERRREDLESGLAGVYSPEQVAALMPRLLDLAARTYADRRPALLRLDMERTLRPDWFQDSRMLGYAAYTDRFASTLSGVRDKLDYLDDLGVTYLHLMPLLQPRPGENDGGYAVADYRTVAPELGTMDDLRQLADDLHGRGSSLVLDLVLNHVAREHAWAQKARAGDERYLGYFLTYPDRTMPDRYEATLPEVFPETAPGSFTRDDDLDAWVWTTFNAYQWDLDWSNPKVFYEFADIVSHLGNVGVDVLRLDAIAFIWKRLGTNCQNQPEVHDITQALRAFARIACPALLFKAEAILAPHDVVRYLGQGRHFAKVSDLAYHNSLMVQVWSMLASQDVRMAAATLGSTPPIPATTAWINYVRCHDDIGWAVTDEDAAQVGLSGQEHRQFLADFFSEAFPGTYAEGLVFQENPLTRDRRISGMTASLAGLTHAVASGSADALDAALDRIRLAHAIVFGWGGVPVLWMGDELAMPNDEDWAADPAHADDNRWLHRPQMDWKTAELRTNTATVAGRVFASITTLARIRAVTPHLHASVASEILPMVDSGVLGVVRRHPLGPWVGLYNVTDQWRPYPMWALREVGLDDPHDTLGHTDDAMRLTFGEDDQVWLPPWTPAWLLNP